MDPTSCTHGNESESRDSSQVNEKEWLADEVCHGICKFISNSHYALVQSSHPLPDNVLIGIVGHPTEDSVPEQKKLKMKKQLTQMLIDSKLILEKANLLTQQSRIALEEGSLESESLPCATAGKTVYHM